MTLKKLAWFPGQGSQHVGMAKDLLDQFKVAREVFEEASESSKKNLRKLCLDGPESDLAMTENTQPCLLAASVAAFRVAESEFGFKADLAAGHSLGEYSALVAIGSVSLSDATEWVVERGRAMQEAVPAGMGGMAAVLMLDDAKVSDLCTEASGRTKTKHGPQHSVEPANYNAPGQVVVSGTTEALAELKTLMTEKSLGRFTPLQVSAPFHSSLMKPARERMAALFSKLAAAQKPKHPTVAYIPNRTARPTVEASLILDFLIEQIDHPVLWKQSVLAALEQGYQTAFEFGPGKVLQGLGKRISKDAGRPLDVFATADFSTWKDIFK